MSTKQSFCASLAKDAKYEPGLRSCFEYRDLGIGNATDGQYHAAVIRVTEDAKGDQDLLTTGVHRHEVTEVPTQGACLSSRIDRHPAALYSSARRPRQTQPMPSAWRDLSLSHPRR